MSDLARASTVPARPPEASSRRDAKKRRKSGRGRACSSAFASQSDAHDGRARSSASAARRRSSAPNSEGSGHGAAAPMAAADGPENSARKANRDRITAAFGELVAFAASRVSAVMNSACAKTSSIAARLRNRSSDRPPSTGSALNLVKAGGSRRSCEGLSSARCFSLACLPGLACAAAAAFRKFDPFAYGYRLGRSNRTTVPLEIQQQFKDRNRKRD